MVETGTKGGKTRVNLMSPESLSTLKTITAAFRELNPFTTVTYYEGRPTPCRVGSFHRDKLQVVCKSITEY